MLGLDSLLRRISPLFTGKCVLLSVACQLHFASSAVANHFSVFTAVEVFVGKPTEGALTYGLETSITKVNNCSYHNNFTQINPTRDLNNFLDGLICFTVNMTFLECRLTLEGNDIQYRYTMIYTKQCYIQLQMICQ